MVMKLPEHLTKEHCKKDNKEKNNKLNFKWTFCYNFFNSSIDKSYISRKHMDRIKQR